MKKLTQEQFENKVKEHHGSDIKILGKYINKRTKIKAYHSCGYIWEVSPDSLMSGHGCPQCSGSAKKTTEIFKTQVFEMVGNEYIVVGKYKNNSEKIKIKHSKCGRIFEMAPKSFLKGQRCPHETYERRLVPNKISFTEAIEKFSDFNNGEYSLVSGYDGISKKSKIRHNKCGNEFITYPNNILGEQSGCPICARSKGEVIIEEYLLENNYNFKSQFRIMECKNKRPLPFDFAIFKNDELHILIEYDGEQHIKPKFGLENFKQTQINDNIKNLYCRENNINLIRIPYKRTRNFQSFKKYLIEELNKILY